VHDTSALVASSTDSHFRSTSRRSSQIQIPAPPAGRRRSPKFSEGNRGARCTGQPTCP
jgi:hypothetical protein